VDTVTVPYTGVWIHGGKGIILLQTIMRVSDQYLFFILQQYSYIYCDPRYYYIWSLPLAPSTSLIRGGYNLSFFFLEQTTYQLSYVISAYLGLVQFGKFLVLVTVALSFVCDKYCPIMD